MSNSEEKPTDITGEDENAVEVLSTSDDTNEQPTDNEIEAPQTTIKPSAATSNGNVTGVNQPNNGNVTGVPEKITASPRRQQSGGNTENKVKGKKLSISDRMRSISSSSQKSPNSPSAVNDSYMQNRWWKPTRSRSTEEQKVTSSRPDNEPPMEEDENNENNMDDNEDMRPQLTPLLMPEPGSPNKRRPSAGRLSFSISNEDVVSPAEKVRLILSDSQAAETESLNEDVMSGLSLHALFCQMDVLCHFDDGIMGWKECARWLKYEEKVESGDRWSKPHVPTISLHALFEVRKAIAENTCSVILDMEASHGCMHQVADTVNKSVVKGDENNQNKTQSNIEERLDLERFVELVTDVIRQEKMLTPEQTKAMVEVLLSPHKHKHRKGKKKGALRQQKKHEANNNDISVTAAQDESTIDGSVTANNRLLPKEKPAKLKKLFNKKEDQKEESALNYTYPGRARPDQLRDHKSNKKLMEKIPGGSEAANIMIGQVEFLEEPIMVFIRLKQPQLLADLTEVDVPTRFIFLVMGPSDVESVWEYEEVGRAMASLFIDKVFCEVAYKASTRQDLVDGIDEYLDDLTVLPSSIWDPSTRLEPPEQAMSMDKIKKRLIDSSRHTDVSKAFHMHQSAGEDVTLTRTGRFFGGMWQDIKRRYPLYWSDIKDGLHPQCLASILFLYFACITPIVTFGGLLGGATDGQMGTMETMISGAMCGLIYHTFAGQPLTIVGATGPLLIFESILYLVCKDNSINFLAFRFYTGAWIALFLLIFVAFDLSSLVKYITRFTEESFAVLISLIFIFEAFKKLGSVWHSHPVHIHATTEDVSYRCHCVHPGDNMTQMTTQVPSVTADTINGTYVKSIPTIANWTTMGVDPDCINYQDQIIVDSSCISETNCTDNLWILHGDACNVDTVTNSVPDVFFFSCFLFLGTFGIAYFFRNFRSSSFFPSIVRSTVADFAVLIAITTCTVTDLLLKLDTPKLKVPDKFATTVPGRGWFVNPIAIDMWYLPLIAIIPALLATILIFLDQQITAVIVNRKEHKLVKSHGYHLDLFILCILIFICSLLGLPWFVAATVRSITHVRSLIKQSELKAPGERPQFLGVREQRFTGICIHILIGLSVFLTSILQHIPMPVLYGVFLYMGVTSLGGVQFVDRILILFMPDKYQPDHIYLRHVETISVHKFTIIQIICMASMWAVKSIKTIAIAFPVMILALCFVRKIMDFVFTQRELFWLDHLLPEATRKAKEDKDKESGDYLKMDEITPDDKMNAEDMTDREKEVMLEGNWDKMIAKRDYGMGRKARNRELSQKVIDRYNKTDEDEDPSDKLLPYKNQ